MLACTANGASPQFPQGLRDTTIQQPPLPLQPPARFRVRVARVAGALRDSPPGCQCSQVTVVPRPCLFNGLCRTGTVTVRVPVESPLLLCGVRVIMVAVGLTDGPENIISKLHNEPNALCKDYENVVYIRNKHLINIIFLT